MSLNSVNTNMGAMVALQSLNHTNTQLAATQKRISTGYKVSDAQDDGAAFAVAQRVRGDVGALSSANDQLGIVQSVLTTTSKGLTNVSNAMNEMKKLLVSLSSGTVTGDQRKQYTDAYNSYVANVKGFFQDSSINGKTLIGNIAGSAGQFAGVTSIRNEAGASFEIETFDGNGVFQSIGLSAADQYGDGKYQLGTAAAITAGAYNALSAATQATYHAYTVSAGAYAALTGTTKAAFQHVGISADAAKAMLADTRSGTQGAFVKMANNVGTALNTYGNAARYVDNQISFNKDKIDSLNSGLGYLVDADLSKEAAQLQALQTRQQLGTQALSIANQAPQSLLSLFRG